MSRNRNAFTLVEMVVAMGVMSLLMGGLAATMMLATKAIPTATTPIGSTATNIGINARKNFSITGVQMNTDQRQIQQNSPGSVCEACALPKN